EIASPHAGIDEQVPFRALEQKHLVVVGVADHAHAGQDLLRDVGGAVAAIDQVCETADCARRLPVFDGYRANGVARLQAAIAAVETGNEEEPPRVEDGTGGGRRAAVEGVVNGRPRI